MRKYWCVVALVSCDDLCRWKMEARVRGREAVERRASKKSRIILEAKAKVKSLWERSRAEHAVSQRGTC